VTYLIIQCKHLPMSCLRGKHFLMIYELLKITLRTYTTLESGSIRVARSASKSQLKYMYMNIFLNTYSYKEKFPRDINIIFRFDHSVEILKLSWVYYFYTHHTFRIQSTFSNKSSLIYSIWEHSKFTILFKWKQKWLTDYFNKKYLFYARTRLSTFESL